MENNKENRIPKIIHYCWFGNKKKPELVEKCIKSWQKYCPDYEIREWNNTDLIDCNNQYVQEAYKSKKYAFVSDYFRLYALYNYGGIYFDSDNEIFKSFDRFLDLDFFSGYENWNGIISSFTAVVGAKKDNHIIKDLLDEYNDLHFIKPDGTLDLYPNTKRVTTYFQKKYSFVPPYDSTYTKYLEDKSIIFPANVFCNYEEGKSYAVHHFNASWCEKQLSFWQKVFSVYNFMGDKYICVLGIKIKIKKRKISN